MEESAVLIWEASASYLISPDRSFRKLSQKLPLDIVSPPSTLVVTIWTSFLGPLARNSTSSLSSNQPVSAVEWMEEDLRYWTSYFEMALPPSLAGGLHDKSTDESSTEFNTGLAGASGTPEEVTKYLLGTLQTLAPMSLTARVLNL